MLGIDKSKFTVITGEYAERLREALRRKYENDPNEEDIRQKERSEAIKKLYRAIWKT